jgi:hypothetical protein
MCCELKLEEHVNRLLNLLIVSMIMWAMLNKPTPFTTVAE